LEKPALNAKQNGVTQMTEQTEFKAPRWEAKFQGRTLGYYDTAADAQAAVDAAQAEADADADAE
jgi:hypothetical protein